MIHHIDLYKLNPEVDEERLEEMIRSTRSQLLKIQEVRNLRCGKRVEKESEWPFFVALDIENLDKLAMFHDDPHRIKFVEEVVKPNTVKHIALDYEMEPGKDVRYS
jgi:hypothetical protein